jgi:hypothetical protein
VPDRRIEHDLERGGEQHQRAQNDQYSCPALRLWVLAQPCKARGAQTPGVTGALARTIYGARTYNAAAAPYNAVQTVFVSR